MMQSGGSNHAFMFALNENGMMQGMGQQAGGLNEEKGKESEN